MGGSGEEEVMEEKVDDESEENQVMKSKENNVPRFLEDDRLLTALLESPPESRTGKFRGSFGTIGGRRRRRKELVSKDKLVIRMTIDHGGGGGLGGN